MSCSDEGDLGLGKMVSGWPREQPTVTVAPITLSVLTVFPPAVLLEMPVSNLSAYGDDHEVREGWRFRMRKWLAIPLLAIAAVLNAGAAKKEAGTTTLKDVQPAGTTDTKHKKKQQYDFIFEAAGNHYTCRTGPKTSVKATDFVVGNDVKYEVKGDKGKLKNSLGEEVKCTVVRVEKVSQPAQ